MLMRKTAKYIPMEHESHKTISLVDEVLPSLHTTHKISDVVSFTRKERTLD